MTDEMTALIEEVHARHGSGQARTVDHAGGLYGWDKPSALKAIQFGLADAFFVTIRLYVGETVTLLKFDEREFGNRVADYILQVNHLPKREEGQKSSMLASVQRRVFCLTNLA